jgi:multidrug efflux pump subunit AcrA (membrane-fusion protein)
MNANTITWRSLISVAAIAAAAFAAPAAEVAPADKPGEFQVPPERLQQIGVTYAKVERTRLRSVLRTVGTVALQTQRKWESVARVDGFVHELKLQAPGEPVSKGQVLLDMYSPELTSTEREYVELLRMRDSIESTGLPGASDNVRRLIGSARERLRQWNVPDEEIVALEASRHVKQYLAIVSPVDGIVQAIPVRQGQRVAAGDPLVSLADLSAVWVWASFYQEEQALLATGLEVTVSTSAYPNEALAGRIALVDPFLDGATRTCRVRIDVENPGLRLRPDMYVDVGLVSDRGEGLTVPAGSVLPTGLHNVVFVDKGGGRLEPRFVELGRKYNESYEVTSGLSEGERIVSSANFLIDAESKLQGALKSW